MTDSPHVLSSSDTAAELADSAFVHGDGELVGSYSTADFASAARLVADVGEVAERLNHHPDILFGYGYARFTLSSHDAGGVTERDLELAREIQELAEAQEATPA